jgi:hypothetical protein
MGALRYNIFYASGLNGAGDIHMTYAATTNTKTYNTIPDDLVTSNIFLNSRTQSSLSNDISFCGTAAYRASSTDIEYQMKFGAGTIEKYVLKTAADDVCGSRAWSEYYSDSLGHYDVDGDGTGYHYISCDGNSNNSTIGVDGVAPTVSVSASNDDNGSGTETVTINAADQGSGLNSFTYQVSKNNGASFGSWSAPITGGSTSFTESDDGDYVIQVSAVDYVGNSSTASTSFSIHPDEYAVITSHPSSPVDCAVPFTVSVDYHNRSDHQVSEWIVAQYKGSDISGSLEWVTIDANSYISRTYTLKQDKKGTFDFSATANVGHWRGLPAVDESDYSNNTASTTITAKEYPDMVATIQTPNDNYYAGEDVITSVLVYNTYADGNVEPSDDCKVEFKIPGVTDQTKDLIVPAGKSQLVWFRWTVPSDKSSVTMTAIADSTNQVDEVNEDNNTVTYTATIYTATESTIPDPGFTLKAPSWFDNFTSPQWYTGDTSSLTWQQWVWENGGFVHKTYSASLDTQLAVGMDPHDFSCKKVNGAWQMKAGYGITENVSTSARTNFGDNSCITGSQLTYGYYPEVNYDFDQNRLLEVVTNGLNTTFQLAKNKYAIYDNRVHFTPLWFPNGDYSPISISSQCWTPAGSLSKSAYDTIIIKGAYLNDWYIKEID